MIESIAIYNYKSIRELTLNFTYAEGKAPNGWQESAWLPFVGEPKTGRYVPILAIYGANASGKSNVIDALNTLQVVIRKGIDRQYHPNRLIPECQNAPIRFIIRINLAGRRFVYELSYDNIHILREWLIEEKTGGNHVLFDIEEGKLLKEGIGNEAYPIAKLSTIFNVECLDAQGNQVKTFMHKLFKEYAGLSADLNAVHIDVINKSVVLDGNDILISKVIDTIALNTGSESVQPAFDEIVTYMKKFDIHIENMSLERRRIPQSSLNIKNGVGPQFLQDGGIKMTNAVIIRNTLDNENVTIEKITSYHLRTDGNAEPFNFYSEESQGTKLLAGILGIILDALKNGRRLFIDELDRSLHPLLLVQIVRMFKSKKLNTKSAQLVFTLHETTLLEDPLLRLSEVGILNNNLYTGTTLARLTDYHKVDKSVRNVLNFRKRYLEGIYAGIPEPIL